MIEDGPFGHIDVHPRRTHEPQGIRLSHLSFNLDETTAYKGRATVQNLQHPAVGRQSWGPPQRTPCPCGESTHRRHSAQEISPRARLSSISSSVLTLREFRRGSAGMAGGGGRPRGLSGGRDTEAQAGGVAGVCVCGGVGEGVKEVWTPSGRRRQRASPATEPEEEA